MDAHQKKGWNFVLLSKFIKPIMAGEGIIKAYRVYRFLIILPDESIKHIVFALNRQIQISIIGPTKKKIIMI